MNRNWRLTTSCGWVVAIALSALIVGVACGLWLLAQLAVSR